jgi:hypothetical protein
VVIGMHMLKRRKNEGQQECQDRLCSDRATHSMKVYQALSFTRQRAMVSDRARSSGPPLPRRWFCLRDR